VIDIVNHTRFDELFKHCGIEDHPSVRIDIAADPDLKDIVVPMPILVRALAEKIGILSVRQVSPIEAVTCGKFEQNREG
jgi:hypothetical protein